MSIKISNISEITGPIRVRFHIEHMCLMGTKVYVIGPGHMTEMAGMSIYGKNPLKIFFSRTVSQMILKLGKYQKRLEPYKSFINDDPGLTLTYFTTRSNLVLKAFEWENVKQCRSWSHDQDDHNAHIW